MKIRLKERLNAVINELDDGCRLADIGCDHGKLSAYALINGKASYVVAVDISQKSLEKTKELSTKLRLNNLETRLGDGLTVINPNEVDTVVIAGMGGMEIIKILSNADKKFKKYVLVPHSNTKELREYTASEFCIEKDYLVKENDKYYDVLVIKEGKTVLSDIKLNYGDNLDNYLLREMLAPKLEKYKNYLTKAKCSDEIAELEQKIKCVEKVLKICK